MSVSSKNTLWIKLFLIKNPHPGSLARPFTNATNSTDLSDFEKELEKLRSACFGDKEHELLAGNIVRKNLARVLNTCLTENSVATIGLQELRSALKFGPVPWKRYNNTEPSEADLSAAPTLEAYYDLKEPKDIMRSLDSGWLFEHNVAAGIAYYDKRFPSIRAIFRQKFEKILESHPGPLDRNTIDKLIEEFSTINKELDDAASRMHYNDECENE
ncbi:unnamed protein product [Caenorhabditis auriculariae]|uniref:Uncharacterized protein n=1 Tax=Caenorhabditis auriculariae TaxID=2777116 RepID=A0A8S1HQP5_9PELO|nr:unnamed protein product [Caenorhabditis auriculariae]